MSENQSSENQDSILGKFSQRALNRNERATDWGIIFACKNLFYVLPFCIPVVGINFLLGNIENSNQLKPEQLFLVMVLMSTVSIWFIAANFIYALSSLRKEKLGLLSISKLSVQVIPKFLVLFIFISTVAISIFNNFIPLLGLLILLLWAPFFCIGEIFSQPLLAVEGKEDSDELDSLTEEFLTKREQLARTSLFTAKSIFDLGILRSGKLAIKNIKTTVEYFLLMWVFSVIPMSLSIWLGADESNYVQIASLLIGNIFSAWIVLVGCGTFLSLVGKEGRKELELQDEEFFAESSVQSNSKFSWLFIADNRFKYTVLFIIATGATFFTAYQALLLSAYPQEVSTKVLSSSISGEELHLRVEIEDSSKLFRWFNKSFLKIMVIPNGTKISTLENKDDKTKDTYIKLDEESKKILQQPRKIFQLTEDDKLVLNGDIKPQGKKLKLELVFDKTLRSVENADYYLLYLNQVDFFRDSMRVIYQGKIGNTVAETIETK